MAAKSSAIQSKKKEEKIFGFYEMASHTIEKHGIKEKK